MVGAAGFEPTTPSPPDWCANQAAPRSDTKIRSRSQFSRPEEDDWVRLRGIAGPRGFAKGADYRAMQSSEQLANLLRCLTIHDVSHPSGSQAAQRHSSPAGPAGEP